MVELPSKSYKRIVKLIGEELADKLILDVGSYNVFLYSDVYHLKNKPIFDSIGETATLTLLLEWDYAPYIYIPSPRMFAAKKRKEMIIRDFNDGVSAAKIQQKYRLCLGHAQHIRKKYCPEVVKNSRQLSLNL